MYMLKPPDEIRVNKFLKSLAKTVLFVRDLWIL